MPGTVIVGAQWGDEGKGKIVDLLAQDSDVVCRYQGGPNAGHTIVVDGEIAGWLGWYEEEIADYHHGGLDIFLATRFHGQRLGREALYLGAKWLIEAKGHHRIIIDPAAANARAIATYTALGFKPVGIMRRYERGPDGEFHDGLLMDLLAEELIPS